MKCFEERTFQDISQTLNISENTVKSRFYKMIRQIKSEVDYQ
ncbi:MAG: sigma factor-like helix-turn-helix DNA-binding protein [Anaerostipes hadrus]